MLALIIAIACIGWIWIQQQHIEVKTKPMLRGFNVLQHEKTAWGTLDSQKSLWHAQKLGADTVAFIPFLRQSSATDAYPGKSMAVTDEQLLAGMQQAKALGLYVILKPQLLVHKSWAGAINPQTGWRVWFAVYTKRMLEYAQIAEDMNVDAFVIGTELRNANKQIYWLSLIKKIRAIYHGELSYTAHGIAGARAFIWWNELDAIGISLYPALGTNPQAIAMKPYIKQSLIELRQLHKDYLKPVWLLEIGMPSASGASNSPWDWWRIQDNTMAVDTQLQADALYLWLQAVAEPQQKGWLALVLLWSWYSYPQAGGYADKDYTPQHKPAELAIYSAWGTAYATQ
ncbi:MAG: hypothetical protein R8L53_00705 [Mariprofundales bacterium]